jgi:hypothetical protein
MLPLMGKVVKKLAKSYDTLSTTERVQADLAAIDRTFKRVTKSKATALAFLQKVGIATKTGRLTKAYR